MLQPPRMPFCNAGVLVNFTALPVEVLSRGSGKTSVAPSARVPKLEKVSTLEAAFDLVVTIALEPPTRLSAPSVSENDSAPEPTPVNIKRPEFRLIVVELPMRSAKLLVAVDVFALFVSLSPTCDVPAEVMPPELMLI